MPSTAAETLHGAVLTAPDVELELPVVQLCRGEFELVEAAGGCGSRLDPPRRPPDAERTAPT
ncbi:MAG: hypothetical protein ACJ72N_26775 [Labedaea sp.]